MSGRTFPTRPEHVHLLGMSGLNRVRFLAVVKHGRGTREVAVDVSPELILQIADALRATAGEACDTPTSRIADEGSPHGYHAGHAIWHVERPDEPMPCVDRCGAIDVLDEGALPPGRRAGHRHQVAETLAEVLERLDRLREECDE